MPHTCRYTLRAKGHADDIDAVRQVILDERGDCSIASGRGRMATRERRGRLKVRFNRMPFAPATLINALADTFPSVSFKLEESRVLVRDPQHQ